VALKGKLDVLQRRMLRLIFGMDQRGHVGPQHYRSLAWLTVKDRVSYFKLVHIFKMSKGLTPTYLSEKFRYVSDVHSYRMRGSDLNFFVSSADSSGAMAQSFNCTAKKEWNRLPASLKSISDVKVFKRDLKLFLISQY
jgi:hypothetical protein